MALTLGELRRRTALGASHVRAAGNEGHRPSGNARFSPLDVIRPDEVGHLAAVLKKLTQLSPLGSTSSAISELGPRMLAARSSPGSPWPGPLNPWTDVPDELLKVPREFDCFKIHPPHLWPFLCHGSPPASSGSPAQPAESNGKQPCADAQAPFCTAQLEAALKALDVLHAMLLGAQLTAASALDWVRGSFDGPLVTSLGLPQAVAYAAAIAQYAFYLIQPIVGVCTAVADDRVFGPDPTTSYATEQKAPCLFVHMANCPAFAPGAFADYCDRLRFVSVLGLTVLNLRFDDLLPGVPISAQAYSQVLTLSPWIAFQTVSLGVNISMFNFLAAASSQCGCPEPEVGKYESSWSRSSPWSR